MIEINQVLQAIKSLGKPATTLAINQAQRNETVIQVLKSLRLDPTQPPKDVDGVYAYTIVEYGVYKPEPILKLFREKDIKTAFWQAYTSNQPLGFLKEVEKFLDWNVLGDEIRAAEIKVPNELEEFGKAFISVAQRTKSPDFQPYPDWNMDEYPEEFKPLIIEKIRAFCGRKFVFQAFAQFLKENTNGYFTLVGDAGMGKSAIAAKYVFDHKSPCYFNLLAENRNRPEQFLESIRQQLIKRYQLQNSEKADLPTLLEKISKELPANERLVIVVDALDEVKQEQNSGDNLLYLPTILPERVYFLLTRRPYTQETKRLYVSPGIPMKELNLTESQYRDLSRDDIKEYIHFILNNDPDYKYALRKWIQERNISAEIFADQVAEKSDNNFMYLRYVLPSIARGWYQDLTLNQLPDGLQNYYQQHWVRMGMNEKPQEAKVIILFILVEIGVPIPAELIAKIAKQDEYDVQSVLNEWVEYLKPQDIEGEKCYSIYHASFLDFLKAKRELQSTRKLFEDVNKSIADYWISNLGR
ncbi:NACHT domain-containing protein [Aetokthonos hydrillicola Thurmond2011]|uniref:NACHT domain-containing protein n=2 Tax=Aetokthonos TaxID=1550243 RepID=A0AAP5IA01_9CYAN|nr:NACHT domain-containing protein [Aetokthonos hydrillicola CCALA 1050]MDR9897601.1 NACHT domain-containing protein [Aetokthonos hydrillicola Thurmond2011]